MASMVQAVLCISELFVILFLVFRYYGGERYLSRTILNLRDAAHGSEALYRVSTKTHSAALDMSVCGTMHKV